MSNDTKPWFREKRGIVRGYVYPGNGVVGVQQRTRTRKIVETRIVSGRECTQTRTSAAKTRRGQPYSEKLLPERGAQVQRTSLPASVTLLLPASLPALPPAVCRSPATSNCPPAVTAPCRALSRPGCGGAARGTPVTRKIATSMRHARMDTETIWRARKGATPEACVWAHRRSEAGEGSAGVARHRREGVRGNAPTAMNGTV